MIKSIPRSGLRRRGTSAFTLIELLVVIGIIVLVSAAMLANMNKFGGAALTQNLAYDIALSMREAQVYGIAVQNVRGSAGFTPAYGMYFNSAYSILQKAKMSPHHPTSSAGDFLSAIFA